MFLSVRVIHQLHIEHGVPQGSIFGSVLFFSVYKDIVKGSDFLNFILYADGSVMFVSGSSINDMIKETNLELYKIINWVSFNKP